MPQSEIDDEQTTIAKAAGLAVEPF